MKTSIQRYKALEKLESELPAQLIYLTKTFTDHALSVMHNAGLVEKNNSEGFVFSLSERQLAKMLDCSKNTAQRWTILATTLGLITRLSEAEAEGYSEYRHYSGIGIQQYALNKIDLKAVRHNWKKWVDSGMSIRQISSQSMYELFPESIYTIYQHTEAFEECRLHREARRAENKVGIQATAQELMIHRNNNKIRRELRRLERNQKGFWSREKKEYIAPNRIPDAEYTELSRKLNNMLDRIIYTDETDNLGITLETIIRCPGTTNGSDVSEFLPVLDRISVKKIKNGNEFSYPPDCPEALMLLGLPDD